MNRSPEISIIVPVYNVEKYLDRCIESIINQTFKNFELILIDDGSTDKSRVICDNYKNIYDRVVVIHKENGGVSSARNAGLDIAKGKYIGFVDSDDYIANDMIEKMVKLAKEHNSDIVSCSYRKFEGEFADRDIVCTKNIFTFSNIEALNNYLLNYNDKNRKIDTVVWNKIYRKNLFDDIEFPKGKIYEDGYVTYRLLYKANKIIHMDDELYYYFNRRDSITNLKFSEKDVKSYDDWRDIFRFIYANQKEISYLAGNKYIKKNINMYIKLCQLENKFDDFEYYKKNIKKDLIEDFDKLNSLPIDRYLKKELKLFKYNYKLVLVLRKIDNIKIKNNIKLW